MIVFHIDLDIIDVLWVVAVLIGIHFEVIINFFKRWRHHE